MFWNHCKNHITKIENKNRTVSRKGRSTVEMSRSSEDVEMGETLLSSTRRHNTPSASDASATSQSSERGEKQWSGRANTETELFREFTGLLADGASAARALKLAEDI